MGYNDRKRCILFQPFPSTNEKANIRHQPSKENSLGSDVVNNLTEDSRHNLWVATEGGGLCLYEVSKKAITKKYNTKNGFPSDYIFKVLEDRNKTLWVTTSKGLVNLDPATGKFHT